MVIFDAKMTTMYTRLLKLPDHSFFLFGPRSTGKTTWLKTVLGDAKWYDLLNRRTYLSLLRNPDQVFQEVSALPSGSWVVIDEVQRIPELLNVVHRVINEHRKNYKFVLSGSSARKLKTLDSNLLAGKVINRSFFPLTGKELGFDFELESLLSYGLLPKVHADKDIAIDVLESYVANYLEQEIQAEAAAKSIDSFSRFLEVAAILNGQTINFKQTASDAGVAKTTVERYFQILFDTLIAYKLPAWNPRVKVKEIKRPKFYFFDPGVVRAIGDRIRDPLESGEKGFLFETLILNELRSYIAYSNCGGKLSYWSLSTSKNESKEIDFIWSRGKTHVGIELKTATKWRGSYGRYLKELKEARHLDRVFGVYFGNSVLKDKDVLVLPAKLFMEKLFKGDILAPG